MAKNKLIRTSKHFYKDANFDKKVRAKALYGECQRVLKLLVDHIWEDGLEWKTKSGEKRICCPAQGYFEVPRFISTRGLNIKTNLTARVLKCLATQACGVVKAATEKQRKRLYVLNQLKTAKPRDEKNILRLKKMIARKKPKKPIIKNNPIELNSLCANFQKTDNGEFLGFLNLRCLGHAYGKIHIPVRNHKHSIKLSKQGNLMTSFLIYEDRVDLRWEMKVPKEKKRGKVLGVDTGKRTVLTLSDGQTSDTSVDPHGHTLDSIMKKMSRKKKGSKAFKKSQEHRRNHINWVIKQINLTGVRQLNVEKVKNIFYKKKRSRLMSHWVNAEIEREIESICELSGVRLVYKDSTYNSQRCHQCGLVRKANRCGKVYKCPCGLVCDADFNSACNHSQDLYPLPVNLRHLKLNRKGFYWTSHGLFNLDGSELTVPNSHKENLG